MRFIISSALVLLLSTPLLAVDPNPKSLAVPADQLARAKELVSQLRNENVDVRDKASTELAKMGRLALPVLLDTLKATTSNEVETRIELLLPASRKDDFIARYPVFLADKDRKYEHNLPGWNELIKATGDTPESRLLFSEILDSEECRANITSAFGTSTVERKAFESRWTTRWMAWWPKEKNRVGGSAIPNWPIEYLVSGLLADLVYDRHYHDTNRDTALSGIRRTQGGKEAVKGEGKYGNSVRIFLLAWVESQRGASGLSHAAHLCEYAGFDPQLRLKCFEKLLLVPDDGRRAGALDLLAMTGDRKYVTIFKALFDDQADRYNGVVRENDGTPRLIQWRDSALAQCILLTKQKHADYGITVLPTNRGTSPYWSDQYMFTTDKEKTADEKREAAFKKWAEWEKANPDALKAAPPKDKK
jgi:hypothetical protein